MSTTTPTRTTTQAVESYAASILAISAQVDAAWARHFALPLDGNGNPPHTHHKQDAISHTQRLHGAALGLIDALRAEGREV